MSVYLDGNIVVALFIPDTLTAKATSLLGTLTAPSIISDAVALEFASTVARKVRAGVISSREGRAALAAFDAWAPVASRLQTVSTDIAAADAIVRRFDINLHGMDALHVAMTARHGASLLTLDAKMRASARKLGVAVV